MADTKQNAGTNYKWGVDDAHVISGFYIDGVTKTLDAQTKEAKDGKGETAAITFYDQTETRQFEAYADIEEDLPSPGTILTPTAGGDAMLVMPGASEVEKGEDHVRRTLTLKRWIANALPAAPAP